jgi:hypothetical protein
MSKIFVLFLGVAAAELTFTAYTEGSTYHKAAVVSNDGCADVQLSDYTISLYHCTEDSDGIVSCAAGTSDPALYQSLVLPTETIAPGASFTICNLRISEYSESAVFADTCDFFTTGGIQGGMHYTGDDTVVLMKSGVTIDTIGAIGSPTHCGSSATTCAEQACVKTAPGAWVNGDHVHGATAWDCGLTADVDPTTLSSFVGVSPSCPGACSVTCSLSTGHVLVTHDTTSDHSHHRCYKEPGTSSDCTCECFSCAAELTGGSC